MRAKAAGAVAGAGEVGGGAGQVVGGDADGELAPLLADDDGGGGGGEEEEEEHLEQLHRVVRRILKIDLFYGPGYTPKAALYMRGDSLYVMG